MKIRSGDTIAAIATPIGEGAIAVVRVSGSDCLGILDKAFRGRTKLVNADGYTVHYGQLVDANRNLVDFVLATVFLEPHSYTGENSVEISCHGGLVVTRLVLESILHAGARQAEPGEFTKRAFLNGKLDLSQAEAVADLIVARSKKAHAISLNQLNGSLSSVLGRLKNDLIEACSLLELGLDFAEEDIPLVTKDRVSMLISNIHSQVTGLIHSFETGRVYKEGVLVVLAGKPNAGKSSLFNKLLRSERAIVSARPGTTRDFIEESVIIKDVVFRLVDTAGLGETNDSVERLGIHKTNEVVARADLVLEVVDSSTEDILERSVRTDFGSPKVVIVLNKTDCLDGPCLDQIKKLSKLLGYPHALVSALTGEGIDALKEALVVSVVGNHVGSEENVCVTSQRHLGALFRCRESLERARESIQSKATDEFVSFDMRQAAGALSELLGEITTDDILNSVFGRFCIGK